MAVGPSHLPLHILESMTENFSKDRILGSGSYGTVYLGEQEDGQKIALKILHDKTGHDDVQFEKEYYTLANLQHQNIVRLVGYCHETRREFLPYNETIVLAEVTKRALCFEFMENGSLSDYLFGKIFEDASIVYVECQLLIFGTPSIHFYKSFQTSEIEMFCTMSETSTKPYKSEHREYICFKNSNNVFISIDEFNGMVGASATL